MAQELEKAKKLPIDKKLVNSVNSYCEAIVEYFDANTFIAGISWYTDFIDTVQFQSSLKSPDGVWKNTGISGDPRREMRERVDIVLNNLLPRALEKVNTAYAALRAQLL